VALTLALFLFLSLTLSVHLSVSCMEIGWAAHASGETALLRRLPTDRGFSGGSGDNALAVVAPVRGRLLLFPHLCPHEGRAVVDAPKVFLRGELY